MSMSLRDQLLAAGLVNQKQVRDAERQQEHQERGKQQRSQQQRSQQQRGSQQRVHKPGGPQQPGPRPAAAASPVPKPAPGAAAQSAKLARDQELNRKQQEKAHKKALAAQIKQLIEQNRVPKVESDDHYNFVDGSSVRFIAVDAGIRSRLVRGEIVIVRHEGRYDVVPKAIAERIRERDPRAVIGHATAPDSAPLDDAYKNFAVPDDLTW